MDINFSIFTNGNIQTGITSVQVNSPYEPLVLYDSSNEIKTKNARNN